MDNLEPFKVVGGVFLAAALVITLFIGGKRYLRRLPPASAYPIQTAFLFCIIFTMGILLVSLGNPFFYSFGAALVIVGLSIWFPERSLALFAACLPILLGYSVFSVLCGLRDGEPIFTAKKMSDVSFGVYMMIWVFGMLFSWQRWSSGRFASGAHTPKSPEPTATVPPIFKKP